MPTQQGLPSTEEKRLVERAKRFYEEELLDQLIEEHKGEIIVIDGYTLQYGVGFNATLAREQLLRKCDKPVTYNARVGYDYVYSVSLPVTVLSAETE